MSFFSKLKQLAGIRTLDVCLSAPPRFRAADVVVAGTLHLVAKSSQSICHITVELRAKFEAGRDDERQEQVVTLGTVQFGEPFRLHAGERRDVPFAVPLQLRPPGSAQPQQRGGLAKTGTWANAEKSTYQLVATVAVRGTTLAPSATADLRLVE